MMMESGSHGTNSKGVGLPLSTVPPVTLTDTDVPIWLPDRMPNSTVGIANNSQLLFIAVEYVDDANIDYSTLDSDTIKQSQYVESLDSNTVSPLDPNMSSAARYSPVYNMADGETNLPSEENDVHQQTALQNSILVVPNGITPSNINGTNGLPLNSVEGNIDLLRQVVSSRLCRQLDPSILETDLKNENIPVELLITNQNTGISYALSSDNLSGDANELNGILGSLEQNVREKLIDQQNVVLDSNQLISLDDHVLMDNGTLVLKTELGADEMGHVVNDIDIELANTITEDYRANGSEETILSDTILNADEPVMENHTDMDIGVRRSVRRCFDRDLDDDEIDLMIDCPDCIARSEAIVNGLSDDVAFCHRHQQHSILKTISDKPVPTRAYATLPAAYLSIGKVTGITDPESCLSVFGVFAKRFIPKRTQFGPVEGVLVEDSENVTRKHYVELILESDTGQMKQLDVSNENTSNWMRFVRAATSQHQQNLVLNQMGPSLYYTTICNILPRQELLVGYGPSYASKRGLKPLPPIDDFQQISDSWPCFECNMMFNSSEELQKHLNVHDKEKDEIKKAKPKRRVKRRPAIIKRLVKHNTCDKKPDPLYIDENEKDSDETKKSEMYNNNQTDSNENDPELKEGLWTISEIMKRAELWLCSDCNLKFSLLATFELHVLSHQLDLLEELTPPAAAASELLVSCPQCDERFTTHLALVEHVSQHAVSSCEQIETEEKRNNSNRKAHKCNMCYKSFASAERLQRHMLVHGSEESKPMQCTVCKKRFLNNSALTCHLKTHNDNREFHCPICNMTFEQVLMHKEHVRTHSENGVYTCPYCNKLFKEYSMIRKHIRAFHCDRKYCCQHCDKPCPTLDKLRMHLLKHSDHREFLCAHCGKQFKRKDKLKEHTRRMHDPLQNGIMDGIVKRQSKQDNKSMSQKQKKFTPKVSPTDYHRFIYKCHTCLLGFKRRGMLVNHLAKRHPDIRPDSVPELNLPILRTTRDYYCQYCDKVYKSSSKRKAHILKNHPGLQLPSSNRVKESDLNNGVLNQTFSQTVGSVTTNPHNCQWCHKQYASKAKLLQHQRKKHEDLVQQQKAAEQKTKEDKVKANGIILEDRKIVEQLPPDVMSDNNDPDEPELPQYEQFNTVILDDKSDLKVSSQSLSNEFLSKAVTELNVSQYFRIVPTTVQQQTTENQAGLDVGSPMSSATADEAVLRCLLPRMDRIEAGQLADQVTEIGTPRATQIDQIDTMTIPHVWSKAVPYAPYIQR